MAIFDKFHEIGPLGCGNLLDSPVVEDQELEFGQLRHQFWIGAIAVGDAELFEQTGQPKVAHGKTLPASLIAQGAGEPCFATAGAGDE